VQFADYMFLCISSLALFFLDCNRINFSVNTTVSFLTGDMPRLFLTIPSSSVSRTLRFPSILEKNSFAKLGTCVIFYSSKLIYNFHTEKYQYIQRLDKSSGNTSIVLELLYFPR
jgi:hypothetical protein